MLPGIGRHVLPDASRGERRQVMQPLPHYYQVRATAEIDGPVVLDSRGLLDLTSAPPSDFDGPGDLWSPETLLVGAVCDCFVLTFRAIAKAAKLAWTRLECEG